MHGFVIVDTGSGAHVVSQAFVKRFGMSGGPESDAETHAHAVAGMLFGLIANAHEAVGAVEATVAGHDGHLEPAEQIHQRLEHAQIAHGHPRADRSPNAAHIVLANLGDVEVHIFQHSVFPLACGVILPHFNADVTSVDLTYSRESFGSAMAESIAKAFCHSFGLDYVEACSRGVAKPYRKLFASNLATCLNACAAKCMAAMCGIAPNALRILPREGLYLGLVSAHADVGRWAYYGIVTNGGADWTCSFGAFETILPDPLKEHVAAFDHLLRDLDREQDPESLEARPCSAVGTSANDIGVEVQGSAMGGFSVLLVPGTDCIAVSSNRLAKLQSSITNTVGTSCQAMKLVRSVVHALAKLRASSDLIAVVDLDVESL